MRFEGKVVVVTGGGQGIGEAYAKGFAAEGASVVIAELNEERGTAVANEINQSGGRALFIKTDVSNPEDAFEVAEFASEHFGGVDILINNAAIFHGIQFIPLMEVDLDYYNKIISVNMNSPLIMSRAIVPLFEKNGGGVIINQSSTAAWKHVGYYTISKLGVQGLTVCMAQELGAKNIRVNAIAPGPIDTEATRMTPEDMLKHVVDGLALKRLGRTEDIVNMAKYIASDEGEWITGQIIRVDGGDTMLPA